MLQYVGAYDFDSIEGCDVNYIAAWTDPPSASGTILDMAVVNQSTADAGPGVDAGCCSHVVASHAPHRCSHQQWPVPSGTVACPGPAPPQRLRPLHARVTPATAAQRALVQ